MHTWVVKISAAAVALTAASYFLPRGNIKKAAMLAFSFLFLTVLLLPLKNFTYEILGKRAELTLEKNLLLAETGENTAEKQVMERYKERIAEEIKAALSKSKLDCSNLIVVVDENGDSETFGYVTSVRCDILPVKEEKKNTIEKVTVPEIVIDLHGIRVETKTEETGPEEAEKRSYEQKAAAVIAELTGAEKSHITVKWSDET